VASPGNQRILIVADQAPSGELARKAIREQLGDGTPELFVVAPALTGSALEHHLGDIDDAINPARSRLEKTLRELREAGFDARGEVGDSDPVVAVSDEIAKFEPARIVVLTGPEEEEAYAEHGLVERLGRDFNQPVTRLVIDDEAASSRVVDVAEAERGAGRDRGRRISRNLPPLGRRDMMGIVVAIVGTVVLAVLAGACAAGDHSPDLEEGRLDGVCPILILIAIGMALLNLAHSVGLVLFESVRYSGIWERFFARMSLYGTPIAVAISLLLFLQR
jgi:hypothetical protein